MKVNRGDIVLVDYSFSDRTGSKVRPCVVIQNDQNNQRLDDTIIAMISSRISRVEQESSQFLIDVRTMDGKNTGLLFDSAVMCENIMTIDRTFIQRKVGSLSSAFLSELNQCLIASLDLQTN